MKSESIPKFKKGDPYNWNSMKENLNLFLKPTGWPLEFGFDIPETKTNGCSRKNGHFLFQNYLSEFLR